nr:unnamed protein product [Callosobruchus analis]
MLRVWFPRREGGRGLVVQFLRLKRTVRPPEEPQANPPVRQAGGTPEADRFRLFPSPAPRAAPPLMHLQGRPVFAAAYRLVDHCYNVTFTQRNGSFTLRPQGALACTFRVYLPYGNRVVLNLRVGDSRLEGDGPSTWSHCTKPGDPKNTSKSFLGRTKSSSAFLQVISAPSESSPPLGVRMSYRAEPVERVVGVCEFGGGAAAVLCYGGRGRPVVVATGGDGVRAQGRTSRQHPQRA